MRNWYAKALQKPFTEVRSLFAEQSKAVQERYSGTEQHISV